MQVGLSNQPLRVPRSTLGSPPLGPVVYRILLGSSDASHRPAATESTGQRQNLGQIFLVTIHHLQPGATLFAIIWIMKSGSGGYGEPWRTIFFFWMWLLLAFMGACQPIILAFCLCQQVAQQLSSCQTVSFCWMISGQHVQPQCTHR